MTQSQEPDGNNVLGLGGLGRYPSVGLGLGLRIACVRTFVANLRQKKPGIESRSRVNPGRFITIGGLLKRIGVDS